MVRLPWCYERQEERLSPLPEIGEGFGEWSEAPSYEEGVGVDGGTRGLALGKKRVLSVASLCESGKAERGDR